MHVYVRVWEYELFVCLCESLCGVVRMYVYVCRCMYLCECVWVYICVCVCVAWVVCGNECECIVFWMCVYACEFGDTVFWEETQTSNCFSDTMFCSDRATWAWLPHECHHAPSPCHIIQINMHPMCKQHALTSTSNHACILWSSLGEACLSGLCSYNELLVTGPGREEVSSISPGKPI